MHYGKNYSCIITSPLPGMSPDDWSAWTPQYLPCTFLVSQDTKQPRDLNPCILSIPGYQVATILGCPQVAGWPRPPIFENLATQDTKHDHE